LVRRPVRNRPLGRHKRRWEGSNKTDIQ